MAAILHVSVIANSPNHFMHRMRIGTGEYVKQADISTIKYSVLDIVSDEFVTGHFEQSLTIATVIFDALQTDSRWTKDTTGYNFRHEMAPAAFPRARRSYRIEFVFTPTSGNAFSIVYEANSIGLK